MHLIVHGSAISCGVRSVISFPRSAERFSPEVELKLLFKELYNDNISARIKIFEQCGCKDCYQEITRLKAQGYKYTSVCAFVLFSDIEGHASSRKFADYIKQHSIGHLLESEVKKNPNTQNLIRVWVWSLPTPEEYKALLKIE